MKSKTITISKISKIILITAVFCTFNAQNTVAAEMLDVGSSEDSCGRRHSRRVSVKSTEAPSEVVMGFLESAKKDVMEAMIAGNYEELQKRTLMVDRAFALMTPNQLLDYVSKGK